MSKLNKKLVKSIAKKLEKSALLSGAYLSSVAGGGGPEMGYSSGANGIYGDASVVPQGYIPYDEKDWSTAEMRIIPREGETGAVMYPCNGTTYSHKMKCVGGCVYIDPVPTFKRPVG